jgi:hypothetical protein
LFKIGIENFGQKLTDAIEELANPKFSICANFSEADLIFSLNPLNPSKWDYKKIVIVGEPKVVRPDLYSSPRIRRYLQIVAVSQQRAEKMGVDSWINLPIEISSSPKWDKKRKKRSVMVIGNKFSANKESNYGLRRKVIRLDEKRDQLIDVFGVDWLDPLWLQFRRQIHAARIQLRDLSDFSLPELISEPFLVPKHYKGIMRSNLADLQEYESAIVIENQSDYVSEKLWNTLSAGVVPFYVGPSLVDYPEIQEIVYELDGCPNEIVNAISNTNSRDLERRRSKIKWALSGFGIGQQIQKFASELLSIVSQRLTQ